MKNYDIIDDTMVNNSGKKHDEVELMELLKDVWNGRLKIILSIIISVFIGVGYIYLDPTSFKNSLNIKSIDKSKFTNLNSAYKIFDVYKSGLNIEKNIFYESIILKKFIDELTDYNELSIVFKNNEIIKTDILNLFTVNKLNNNEYILNFFWHDIEEAKNILNQTLNLTYDNFKKLLHQELIDLWEIEKTKILNQDLSRINFLTEHSLIAKELNLEDGNISQTINVYNDTLIDPNKNFDFNINSTEYLRGFKAIDKEIELIKSRQYKNFIKIKKNIDNIKNQNFSLINFDILKIYTKPTKNSKLILLISIILGILIGICYALIDTAFQKSKNYKKD